MDQEPEKSGRKMWLYFIPVCIILAIPLVKWTVKINSSDVNLSKDAYNAFNSQEGVIKKNSAVIPPPDLDDSGYSLHYKSNKSAAMKRYSFGFTKGYLTSAIGKAMNNPKDMSAILNDKHVIRGFMSRDTVKTATASPKALANYLKNGNAIRSFMGSSVVQSALDNPRALSAAASSAMISALLDTPAAKSLLSNPPAAAAIVKANPRLMKLMADPRVKGLLMSNPRTNACIRRMNIGGTVNDEG